MNTGELWSAMARAMSNLRRPGICSIGISNFEIAMNCRQRISQLKRSQQAEEILRQELAQDGPAVVQAVVDPNEPLMPGNVCADQSIKFSKALIKGQKDSWEIFKGVVKDQIREVV